MKDTVIKGNGKSRIIKAPADMPSTFEEWRTQLLAGTARLDVSMNTATTGDDAGITTLGTVQNKANLLDDTTKAALELTQGDPTVNNALYALSQKSQPAIINVTTTSGTVVTATMDSIALTATANSSGLAVLYPTEFGVYTVSATVGGAAKSTTVYVNAIAIFETALMPALSACTWAQISAIAESGKASVCWSVGDEKTITVNGVSYTAVIIGFDHDDKTAGGKAGITFQLKTCLATTYYMNSSNTNSGGWNSCYMRTSYMATFLSQLNSDLKAVIKQVNKKSSAGSQSATINTTADKLFLLSEVEIFGTETYAKAGEGSQYAYYAAGNSKIKTVNGSANSWWERSPVGSNTTVFCYVYSNGNANYDGASGTFGVSFGFCV